MKKYVIYQRVSTEEQKQKGYSLEAMLDKCQHYIKSQDEALSIKAYEDAGFSGSQPLNTGSPSPNVSTISSNSPDHASEARLE